MEADTGFWDAKKLLSNCILNTTKLHKYKYKTIRKTDIY
jgi:hypothetical protein